MKVLKNGMQIRIYTARSHIFQQQRNWRKVTSVCKMRRICWVFREKLAKIARREPVAKSSKQRYVLIVRQSLPYKQSTGHSVQRIVAIKQGRIKRKADREGKRNHYYRHRVGAECKLAVPTGLHTVSRNSVQMNVQR